MKAEKQGVEASYKVLVLGDRGVGKTSLLHSLTGKPFQDTMLPTVGADFTKKKFNVDGAAIELIIWDSSGQGQLRSINKQQYKDLKGLILVYDVTNEASLDTLKYWTCSLQHELNKSKGNYEPTPMIVCGNKCDLSPNKEISSVKDDEMAFGFYEMSAKTGENVHAAFQRLAYHITDICNPKLSVMENNRTVEVLPSIHMKSYHPHCEKPLMSEVVAIPQGTKLREFNGKGKKKAKNKKPDSGTERTKKNQNTVEHVMHGNNVSSSYNDATSCPSLFTCCICFRNGKADS